MKVDTIGVRRRLHRVLTGVYEVWLWRSRNDFIASLPVYIQPTERDHFRITPLGQLCT